MGAHPAGLELDDDEVVLWSGRPDPLGYAWHRGLVTSIASGLFLLAFTAFLLLGLGTPLVSRPRQPPHTDFFSMPPPPLPSTSDVLSASPWWLQGGLVIGLLILFATALALLLSPAWQAWAAQRTRYLLTNKRAILEIASPFARRRTFALANLRFVELRPAEANGGHVLFAQGAWGFAGAVVKDGFIAIPQASEVERLVRRADLLPAQGPGG